MTMKILKMMLLAAAGVVGVAVAATLAVAADVARPDDRPRLPTD